MLAGYLEPLFDRRNSALCQDVIKGGLDDRQDKRRQLVAVSELKSLIPVALGHFPLADLRRKLMKLRPVDVLEFQDQELTE